MLCFALLKKTGLVYATQRDGPQQTSLHHSKHITNLPFLSVLFRIL
jgi:hypothetical protein